MTMSASSLGLELIMWELVMGDIRGSGDTSARAHKALIIAVVTITEWGNLNLNCIHLLSSPSPMSQSPKSQSQDPKDLG